MVDFDRRLLRWAEYAFPDASLNGPRERERVSGAPTDVVINAGFLYGHVAEGNLKNGKFTSAVNPRGYSIGSVDEDKILSVTPAANTGPTRSVIFILTALRLCGEVRRARAWREQA